MDFISSFFASPRPSVRRSVRPSVPLSLPPRGVDKSLTTKEQITLPDTQPLGDADFAYGGSQYMFDGGRVEEGRGGEAAKRLGGESGRGQSLGVTRLAACRDVATEHAARHLSAALVGECMRLRRQRASTSCRRLCCSCEC